MRIRNWDKFQAYKTGPRAEGRMVWVRLYLSLLDDRHFHALSGDDAKTLVMLWLLGGEDKGNLPAVEDIAFRFRMDEKALRASLARLSAWLEADGEQIACDLQADCLQPVSTEEKRGEKKRTEYSEAFEELWAIHRRGSKPKAWKEYLSAVDDGVDHDSMAEALDAYVQTLRPDFQGVHLERWIRDERWLEHTEGPAKPKPYQSGEVAEW